MTEVRYHMLRPGQVVKRRKECPVVYIPIGTLEWHGLHNPLGADTIQAEGLAILCAQQGGGLVFPPLYFGESRGESLMESVSEDRELIAEEMELPPENFLPDKHPFSATEQTLNYHRLLLHILAEAESLGFELGVLVAGHYPLVDSARAAVIHFNKRRYSRYHGMSAWAFVDYALVRDKWPDAGDHAGGWETSHLLALAPGQVDLSVLPAKGEKLIGVGAHMPPQDATAEFGRQTLQAAAERAVKEVRHRLANPEAYREHGDSLREGLWRGREE
jgi:creatinine amidohydrolase